MLHLTATGFLWKLPVSMLFLCSTGYCHYIMSATVANQPLSRRQALIHTAVMVAEMIVAKLSIALLSHNTGAIMALIVSAFLARFLYGARGRGWLSLSLRLMLANVVMEMICALFIHLLTTQAHILSGKLTFLSLETLMDIEVMALSCTMTSIAGLIYSGFIRLLRRLARSLRRRDSRARVKTLGL